MSLTEPDKIIKGYKATDGNMCCRGFQFELGKWYNFDGDLSLCESGFHFCQYPSGPWAYYTEGRLFEVETREVLISTGPGADLKHVCKQIKLAREITVAGNRNTGYWNTGDGNTGNRNTGDGNVGDGNTGGRNTGYWNTGNRNTGDGNTGNRNTGDGNTGGRNTGGRNTGYWNTGDGNTGYWNTGYRNTGDGNVGDRNTGNRNTGDGNTGNRNTGDGNTGGRNTGGRNTGYWNTGYWNTGYWNTGYRNTGDGNVGDHHSGAFNYGEAKFFMFNKLADRSKVDFYLVSELCELLSKDTPIDPLPFLSLPNATVERIKELHNAHIRARADKEF